MNKKVLFLLAPALLLGVHTAARAEVKAESFSLSPYIGGYTFIGKDRLETMPVYGLRAGYNLSRHFGLEAVFDYVNTEGKKNSGIGDGVDVYNYHLDALFHLMPESQLVPYLAMGFGGQSRKYPSGADTDHSTFNYGLGAKYFLKDALAIRGDVRHLMPMGDGERVHNLEYTVGMDFIFGGVKEAPVAVAAPAPKPEPVPAPVVVPPPPALPTDQLTITPASVTKGDRVTLTWTSSNATSCAIEPGIGPVPTSGSMSVTPAQSADYTLVCNGAGGTAKSLAKVDVVAPPPAPAPAPVVAPPPPPPVVVPVAEPAKLCKPAVINIKFDTNKSDIKPQYHDELKAVGAFLKEFPQAKGTIEGHTDNVGTKAANMKLSQRRAESVRNYLIKNFDVAPDRIKAVGYGPTKPVASNKTAAGKQQNRRIESNFSCE
ncbi:OmpA family protein [Geomonas anaerohicana]|uniref:Outer membrane beta-barrel domain-containing protein n=1 Tax=Geomonas anaerohicana TaxID=2798583 RepID=A0ABS0Y9X4_9BACT|nr:OmpA family protein [Geomonas anaerohicana]MBJ6749092.1 outer membrane beta-barrel domain-containing protein [Geomonas anaerohicana]